MMPQGKPQQSKQQQGGPLGGGPMAGLMRGGEKPRNFKATMSKLLQYLSEYKVSIVIVFVFAIASTIFMIA
ncbi:MAG: ABC transporter ATP-binding protein, partial [Anaerolineae bacterium]|nr:ABC transporter ATP-binding protein [Anaerolineae bacterium]